MTGHIIIGLMANGPFYFCIIIGFGETGMYQVKANNHISNLDKLYMASRSTYGCNAAVLEYLIQLGSVNIDKISKTIHRVMVRPAL